MKILVADLETTGFTPYSDAIVEIGLALVDTETKEIDIVFDKIVKHKNFDSEKHKGSWIFQNTNLNWSDVEKAEPLSSYHAEIQTLFDLYPITAYNKSFDMKFLSASGFKFTHVKCLMAAAIEFSTYINAKKVPKRVSMENMYNEFFSKDGDVYVEKHRAGADAKDEAKMLLHLVRLKDSKLLVVEGTVEKPINNKALGPHDKIKFGKYKGESLQFVIVKDSRYLNWCIENVRGFELNDECKKMIKDYDNKVETK